MDNVKGLRARVRDVIIAHLSDDSASNAKTLIGEEAQIVEDITDDILGELNNYSKDIKHSSSAIYIRDINALRVESKEKEAEFTEEIGKLNSEIGCLKSGLKRDEVIRDLGLKLGHANRTIKHLKKLNKTQQSIIEELI